MSTNSLQKFTQRTHEAWSPLTTELINSCRSFMGSFILAPESEEWLASLLRKHPDSEELYRDPDHDFLLLAHAERQGTFRSPHDHGRSWVMYSVQNGEMEHRTYAKTIDEDGRVRLVLRDTYIMRPREVRVYLPGDIHDTRCLSGNALYYRFTSRDLKKDERAGHKVTRYVERDGFWTLEAQ